MRPKAEAISTKTASNCNGYGRNKLPPSPTHRQGGGNCGRKTPGLKPAPSARALKTATKYTRNLRPKESVTASSGGGGNR